MGKVKTFYTGQTVEKIHANQNENKKKTSRKSNPLPFYIPFFTKKVPLSYIFDQ